MLERFYAQRRAITTVLPETTCTAELTFSLVGQLVTLLCPFEEFSCGFKCFNTSISSFQKLGLLLKHVTNPVVDEENPVIKTVYEELESAHFIGV